MTIDITGSTGPSPNCINTKVNYFRAIFPPMAITCYEIIDFGVDIVQKPASGPSIIYKYQVPRGVEATIKFAVLIKTSVNVKAHHHTNTQVITCLGHRELPRYSEHRKKSPPGTEVQAHSSQ